MSAKNKAILEEANAAIAQGNTDSLYDSKINSVLVAIAQDVAELLKQSYLVQADEIDSVELISDKSPQVSERS